MKWVWFILVLLFVSSLLVMPTVSAQTLTWPAPTDFASNFDNFPSGTVNPFPWGYTAGCSSSGVVSSLESRSAPYSYVFSFSANCAPSNAGYLTATFNATETNVNATVYVWGWYNICTTSNNQAELYVSSTAQTKIDADSDVCSSTSPGAWIKLSVDVAAVPGQSVTVKLNASESTYIASANTVPFDDFSVIGAAAYTSSQGGPAINLQLYNDSSAVPYWFDPSGYTVSYVLTQWANAYNNSNQWTNAPTSGLSVAGMNITNHAAGLTLTSATLVTVYVGGSYPYTRTVIPSKSGTTDVYLDNPLSVNSYYFYIQSPGITVAGDYFFIEQSGHNITSGYVDSAPSFSVWLTPGTYTIKLVNQTSPYNTVFTGEYILSPSKVQTYQSCSSGTTSCWPLSSYQQCRCK